MFDSDRLKPVIASVGEKLVPIEADKRLKDVQQTLMLVDGSIEGCHASPWRHSEMLSRAAGRR